MLNLAHFLDVAARQFGNCIAVQLDEFQFTYAELAAHARRAAALLVKLGVEPGDKVAMMIPNTPHFPILYYGILHAGAVVVPVNCLFTHHEIKHYLDDAEVSVFFAFKTFEAEASAAFNAAERCRHLVIVAPPGDTAPHVAGEDFAQLMHEAGDAPDMVQTMPDDTAVLLYTSGTTGMPKGAELTHFNMFFNAYLAARELTRMQPGDIALGVLPLFHSFGQTAVMNTCVLSGATMTLLARFETQRALEVMARDRVTHLCLVPTMYQWLLNAPDWEAYDLSSLRMAGSGGSPLPEEVFHAFAGRYGINIQEGYGLSETSPVASFTRREDARPGSIGKAIWGVDMRIMREDGAFAAQGEVGEIVLRGHNIMKGYLNSPKATEEALAGGWFHTGDLGMCDGEGFFHIVDRKKDLIIRSGMNIYPRELEEVFYGHPKILEVAVVGIPDKERGEEVKVFASPKAGQDLQPGEIVAYARERMAKYKWPKEVAILSELPKGPTGKILKRELRDL